MQPHIPPRAPEEEGHLCLRQPYRLVVEPDIDAQGLIGLVDDNLVLWLAHVHTLSQYRRRVKQKELSYNNQPADWEDGRPLPSVRDDWGAGGMSTLKTMKTASRTMKSGRDADGMSERGHLARVAPEKRKTSEKANVFHNLASLSWEVRLPSRATANGEREGNLRWRDKVTVPAGEPQLH